MENKAKRPRWLNSKRPRREDIRQFILVQGKIQSFHPLIREKGKQEESCSKRKLKQSTIFQVSSSRAGECVSASLFQNGVRKKRSIMSVQETDDVKENIFPESSVPLPEESCCLDCTASLDCESFDRSSARLATPPKGPHPATHLDRLNTDESFQESQLTSPPQFSCAASQRLSPELELKPFGMEENSWDSIIDGSVSSQLSERHKMCEESLLEILNLDTDDLLAKL